MKFTKELKAGIIVLTVLGTFYWMVQFLKGKNILSSGKHYYIVVNELNDLDVSRKVKINGYQIGHVEDIQPRFNEKTLYPDFVVRIKLDKDYKLTDQTIGTIKSPGITQGAEVVLILKEGKTIHSGDTIKGVTSPGMLDQFTPTQDKIDSVLITLNSTLKKIELVLDNKNRDNIAKTLDNLNNTIVGLDNTSQKYGQLADEATGMVQENRENIKKLVLTFDKNINKFGELAEKLNNTELETIFLNLKQASVELNSILAKVNQGDGSAGALINDKTMYTNLENASKSLELLLNDLKENPKRYVHFSIFGANKNKE